jgi:hypothetical protein
MGRARNAARDNLQKCVQTIMLPILLVALPITSSAFPPCLTPTIKVFLKFGGLIERFYNETIWLQILKTLRQEKNPFRELLRR